MRKSILLFFVLVIFTGAGSGLRAQSIQNSAFKFYVDQLNDTLTLHIARDSSYVSDGRGEVVVRSIFTISKDTVTMNDYEGQYACPGQAGVYTYTLKGNILSFSLVGDPCEGRKGTLNGAKWIRQ